MSGGELGFEFTVLRFVAVRCTAVSYFGATVRDIFAWVYGSCVIKTSPHGGESVTVRFSSELHCVISFLMLHYLRPV